MCCCDSCLVRVQDTFSAHILGITEDNVYINLTGNNTLKLTRKISKDAIL